MFIAAVALCLLIIELAMVLDLRSPLFRIFSNFMYETASVNVIVVLIMSYTSFDFYTSAASGFAALYVIIIAVASIVAGFILYNPIRLLEKMKADS